MLGRYKDYVGVINNKEIDDKRDGKFDEYEKCLENALYEALKLI